MASKGGIGGKPMAPRLSSSPSIATGLVQNPAFRGKSLEEIQAMLPTFNSWEEAARYDWSKSPLAAFGPLTDEGVTNLLGSLYGLNTTDYKVEGGELVDAKGFLARNVWWIAPAAMVGGPALGSALGGGGGGGAAAAAGATAGGAGSAAGGLGAALGGGAAAAGAGGLAKSILGYLLPSAGSIVNGILQNNAANAANKTEQQYAERAFQAALEDQGYQRRTAEEQRAYDRKIAEEQQAYNRQQEADRLGRFADYTAKFDPYVQRGNAAGSRLEELLLGGFGRK